MKKFCLFLAFLLIFTLAGCGIEREPVALDAPAPAAVTLDTCAQTSRSRVIETETGYYAKFGSILYYADKSDLSNWVPVCNNPECTHSRYTCPANPLSDCFYENGRLYSLRDACDFDPKADTYGIYSMNLDGTDLKQEYLIGETGMNYGGGLSHIVYGNTIYIATSTYQTDGTCRNRFIRAQSDGYQILSESTTDTLIDTFIFPMKGLHGEPTFKSAVIGTDDNGNPVPCRLNGDSPEEIPGISDYECTYGYLSGVQLYHFLPGDGYYITDLSTGESRRWMDAQLSDSRATQFNGQYIVETNMYYNATPDAPQLRVYDGEVWHEVACPEGIWKEGTSMFDVLALSTEYIFVQAYHHGTYDVYCISYADGSYALQYCGSFE